MFEVKIFRGREAFDAGLVERALADYLEGIEFKNCKVNEGYLKALGLR